jgi:hypothetical protein
MSQVLSTNIFYGTPPATPVSPPAPSFTMPEPLSYEFQVVEYVQDGKVTKVALQIKQNTHDQYGNIKTHGIWQEVPRQQVRL